MVWPVSSCPGSLITADRLDIRESGAQDDGPARIFSLLNDEL